MLFLKPNYCSFYSVILVIVLFPKAENTILLLNMVSTGSGHPIFATPSSFPRKNASFLPSPSFTSKSYLKNECPKSWRKSRRSETETFQWRATNLVKKKKKPICCYVPTFHTGHQANTDSLASHLSHLIFAGLSRPLTVCHEVWNKWKPGQRNVVAIKELL